MFFLCRSGALEQVLARASQHLSKAVLLEPSSVDALRNAAVRSEKFHVGNLRFVDFVSGFSGGLSYAGSVDCRPN